MPIVILGAVTHADWFPPKPGSEFDRDGVSHPSIYAHVSTSHQHSMTRVGPEDEASFCPPFAHNDCPDSPSVPSSPPAYLSQGRSVSVANLPRDVRASELSMTFAKYGVIDKLVLAGEMVSALRHQHTAPYTSDLIQDHQLRVKNCPDSPLTHAACVRYLSLQGMASRQDFALVTYKGKEAAARAIQGTAPQPPRHPLTHIHIKLNASFAGWPLSLSDGQNLKLEIRGYKLRVDYAKAHMLQPQLPGAVAPGFAAPRGPMGVG